MTLYNEIINTFENLVGNHKYYRGFGHGSIEKIDAVVNHGYPLLFVRPLSSPGLTGVDGRQRELVFEIYSLDVPRLSDEDGRLVMSNTEQGLYDVYAYILDGPVQYDLQITMTNLVPLYEAFQDKALGWVMTVTITTDAVGITYCDIPGFETTSTTTVAPTTTTSTTSTTTVAPTTTTSTTSTTTVAPTTTTTSTTTVSPNPAVIWSNPNVCTYDDTTLWKDILNSGGTTNAYSISGPTPLVSSSNGLLIENPIYLSTVFQREQGANDISYQFYGNVNNTGNNLSVFSDSFSLSNSQNWYIDTSTSKMIYQPYEESVSWITGSITLDNNPHLYTVLFSSSSNELKLYEDNTLIGQGPLSSSLFGDRTNSNANPIWFSDFTNSTTTVDNFSGSVVGINVWTGILTETEISSSLYEFQNLTC